MPEIIELCPGLEWRFAKQQFQSPIDFAHPRRRRRLRWRKHWRDAERQTTEDEAKEKR